MSARTQQLSADRFSRTSGGRCRIALAAVIVATLAPATRGQIASLDKGHQLLVNNGLQIWGLGTIQSDYPVDYGELTAANMTAVMWGYDQSSPDTLSAGQKWGKWVHADPTQSNYTSPATSLNATESARASDLVAIQVGDEQQSDMENPTGYTKAWFDAAHSGNLFNNSLLYVNSFFIINHANYARFLTNANPDAISWDGYPFGNPHGGYILPKNWLSLGNVFRRHGLGTYIGATGASPRPYGLYVQTFNDGVAVDPGEVEIRWQQFAAWTMGYKFVDAFIYRGGNNNFGGQPNGPVYLAFQETARQGRNLGPALTKLISYGYGPSFVQGAGSSGIPGEWITFDRNNAQPSQRYLTGVSNVTNLGTKNSGLSGDVYVGFFNPLHLNFGDPTGTTYFMVMNGLGGDLTLPNGQSDNTATVAETRQQMILTFDFGVTGINSLLRLNRNTGLVDVINTSFSDGGNVVFTSLGNGKYQLQLKLDGGTGDLFKYNDGTPFVGVQAAVPLGYWDSDGNAGNNSVVDGAGLGGTESWEAAGRWYNGSTNGNYAAASNIVFAGTAGTVTVSSPKSATSLQFKSDGYTITGSTLTLEAPTVMTDAGVTATINSTIAGSSGLIKNGPGTLNLGAANTYGGNTTINEGVLGIASASLGAVPGSPTPNIQINHGSTLRFNPDNISLAANRQVVFSDGAVFDTNGNNATIAGNMSGTTFNKIGSGTLTLSGSNSHASIVVTGGALQVSGDTNLGAVPASFTGGNLTFDGGTLRFGGNFDINNFRGINLGAGGGTIDTQGFSNPSGYKAFQGGFRGDGDLIKLGSGTFFAAATSGGANTTWKGRLIIKEGTWKIVASDGLPYNVPSADGLKADQVTLDGGTWQIGATISVTNGRRGITVASGGGTIDTQANNFTWAGPIAGSDTNAVLNKTGSGILTFTGVGAASTYNGMVNINAGTLRLNNGNTMGSLATINLANVAGATFHVTGNQTIGSLGGGGTTGGNVALSAITLTTGGNNKSTTFSGVISGSGAALTKTGSGTMTLTRANTYSGATTVATGTLAVNGSIAGSAIVQNGGTLAGTGTIGGTTTVQSGGILSPGNSPGTITTAGLTLQAGSSLHMEIGPTSDQVVVRGSASLNGTLIVSLENGFTPALGQTFTLLSGNSVNGVFSAETLPSFLNLTFDVIYNPQSVVVRVVPEPLSMVLVSVAIFLLSGARSRR